MFERTIKPIGMFAFHTIITACVIYSLTYAVNVLSEPVEVYQTLIALILSVTAGSVVFNGVASMIDEHVQERKRRQINQDQGSEDETAL